MYNQAKKGNLDVFTRPIGIIKDIKTSYLKKKLRIRVVLDYTETRFSNFAIGQLRKNEKVRETVFACL